MSEVYLAHHGVKGQKWGIRRYQNPDGSLTEAGTKRYINDSRASIKKMRKEAIKSSATLRKLATKNYKIIDKATKKVLKHPDDEEKNRKIETATNKKIDKQIEKKNQIMLAHLKDSYAKVATSEELINGRKIYTTKLQDKYGNVVIARDNGSSYQILSAPASTSYVLSNKEKN